MSDVITASQAKAQFDLWFAADAALAAGKSYTIGNRQLTRADATEVANRLAYWRRAYMNLTDSGDSNFVGGGAVATWS